MKQLENVKIPKEKRDQLSDFAKRRMIYMGNYRVKKIIEELREGGAVRNESIVNTTTLGMGNN